MLTDPPDDDATEDAAYAADEAARIKALQQSAPAAIYLQVDPEAEQFDGWEAQTWCEDKINESDVRYIRADLADETNRPTSPPNEGEDEVEQARRTT